MANIWFLFDRLNIVQAGCAHIRNLKRYSFKPSVFIIAMAEYLWASYFTFDFWCKSVPPSCPILGYRASFDFIFFRRFWLRNMRALLSWELHEADQKERKSKEHFLVPISILHSAELPFLTSNQSLKNLEVNMTVQLTDWKLVEVARPSLSLYSYLQNNSNNYIQNNNKQPHPKC